MRLLRFLTNRSIASLLEVHTGVLLFNIKKFLKCTSSTSQPLQQTCLPTLGKLYNPQQHESSSLLCIKELSLLTLPALYITSLSVLVFTLQTLNLLIKNLIIQPDISCSSNSVLII